jgi:small subunit ribosomal protein S5
MLRQPSNRNVDKDNLTKKVVSLRWVYSLNAGGRKQRMSVFVVVGNNAGKVGFGLAKAKDTSSAVKKAITTATKSIKRISMKQNRTTHHDIVSKYCASMVKIRSGAPGSGIKCSNSARLFVESLGMKDIVVKSYGSNNPINLIKALHKGLSSISSPHDIAMRRGVSYARVIGRTDAKVEIVTDVATQEG